MHEIYILLKEVRPEFNFEDSQDFIEDGYLDSFDLIALVSIIEEKYDVIIDALDILPENFANAESIKNLIIKSGGNVDE